ncbi:hypothetical protein HRW18_18480 [Streptomyces lunaelactis]|uniref:hypothetical protein n=1 Tax=Streptomyces lunaelactis TaxID=1535768 RepID=UPI001585C6DF|nr:hypothetical protein [Streptomyces lunaelactis]NUK09953.1 hypothetical protein [Streptomyces lunaelactis]NUK72737.1 hypothetical protein [Streptomyces lunaelactis]NUL11417.1 hypothetical protein [Streptomyces lunaelactis]NUL25342.1 hypothetical protein [Streptomyces lunaelactis]
MTEQAQAPQTVWDCCGTWADLLITLHAEDLQQHGTRRLTEGETVTLTGLDRHLVELVIAAALHERILRMDLPLAAAAQVPLAAPAEEGVTGTLRRAAYNALTLTPDTEGQPDRALLLREAASPHPDDQTLWQRVRTAALDVVAGVASRTPANFTGPRHPDAAADGPYWERGITIADVLIGVQRRQGFEVLAQVYGEED